MIDCVRDLFGLSKDVLPSRTIKALFVHLDADGRPKLQQVFESIGRDPKRPEEEPGSFIEAIKNRKLYYSGLGGRVVDDKRVFQAVSNHLAPQHADEGAPIARPPRTLELRRGDFRGAARPDALPAATSGH